MPSGQGQRGRVGGDRVLRGHVPIDPCRSVEAPVAAGQRSRVVDRPPERDETRDERAPTDPAGLGDGARVYARNLRLRLLTEHLDRAGADGRADTDDLVDPAGAVRAASAAADALEEWHAGGRTGARPPGRLRHHRPERLPLRTKLWAVPAYKLIYDPDGRPPLERLRRRGW